MCFSSQNPDDELSLMGYSMRTPEYRYTAYYNMLKSSDGVMPDLLRPPYEEELFDHKNETLADFTHREIVNLAYRPLYVSVIAAMRVKLAEFITANMKFGNH